MAANALFAVSGGGGGRGFNQIQTLGQNQPLTDYSPETQAELARLERRRQIANLLMQQGLSGGPAYTQAGRFVVPRGWSQNVGDLAKMVAGVYGNVQADKAGEAAIGKENEAYAKAIEGYKQKIAPTPAQPPQQVIGTSEDENTMTAGVPAQPASNETKQQAILEALLSSRIPALQKKGMYEQSVLDTAMAREDTQAARAQEAKLAREARAAQAKEAADMKRDLQAQLLADKGDARALEDKRMREMQAERLTVQREQHKENLDAKADMKKFQLTLMQQSKPLPPTVLKEANDIIDTSRGVGLVNINFQKHIDRIKNGTLDLGLMKNWLAAGKNLAGISDDQSQAFNEFTQDVEGARNSILLAAKGVQTEGDALRAINQIMKNQTDPKVVMDSLQKQIDNNTFLQKTQDKKLDFLYGNYNIPPTRQAELGLATPPLVGTGAKTDKQKKLADQANLNSLAEKRGMAYSDPDKEKRYQEWKATQGQ